MKEKKVHKLYYCLFLLVLLLGVWTSFEGSTEWWHSPVTFVLLFTGGFGMGALWVKD